MAVVTQSNVRYSSIVHNVSRNINREQELNQIIQHVIKSDNDSTVLPYQNVTASRGDVVTAGFSTFASIHSYSIHSLVCNLLSWWLARLVGGHSSQLACSASRWVGRIRSCRLLRYSWSVFNRCQQPFITPQ
jgi:hypothetical protein